MSKFRVFPRKHHFDPSVKPAYEGEHLSDHYAATRYAELKAFGEDWLEVIVHDVDKDKWSVVELSKEWDVIGFENSNLDQLTAAEACDDCGRTDGHDVNCFYHGLG